MLPLWGQMQKAQDDPETIEEAIARMIAEHEADPEAHLGEGESLSMHKHEDVIDHPAGSLLPDKWSRRDFIYTPNFESLGAYTVTSGTVTNTPGSINLVPGTGSGNTARLIAGSSLAVSSLTGNSLSILQFQGMTGLTSKEGYAVMGIRANNFNTGAVGFHIVGGDVYSYQRRYAGSATVVENLLPTVPAGGGKMFRVEFDPVNSEIRYYYDGDLVDTQSILGSYNNGTGMFDFEAINTGGGAMGMRISNVFFSIEAY